YTIYLSEEDCHRLSAARLIKSLHEAVERKVIRENCFMEGALSVKIKKMTADDNAIVIVSSYVDESGLEEDTINLENDVLSHTLIEDADASDDDQTIIANKSKIIETMRSAPTRKVEYNLALLTDYKTREIVFGERQIYLGRKETNDFVLADESASRIHAYIAYERHRHVLYDAGSLNGTFVNKRPISRHELRDGDKILIGRTTLTYKVL
ncbi:MAG: FHA domain-containing protein, partial [Selenomonadaceae bacterium]|nr:FHA domain-containing protein [Selenomonadaceae bacterium]